PRNIGAQHAGQDLLRGLDQTLGPAGLLGLERGHFDRQLGGTFHILEIFEFPALELAAIGEVSIFRERIVLPTACVFDGLPPPHSCRAIEIEKDATARTSPVFEDKVTIEKNGFYVGKE